MTPDFYRQRLPYTGKIRHNHRTQPLPFHILAIDRRKAGFPKSQTISPSLIIKKTTHTHKQTNWLYEIHAKTGANKRKNSNKTTTPFGHRDDTTTRQNTCLLCLCDTAPQRVYFRNTAVNWLRVARDEVMVQMGVTFDQSLSNEVFSKPGSAPRKGRREDRRRGRK